MRKYREMDNPYKRLEREDDYFKWSATIPFINFPSDWLIRIEPPFNGTMARFLVRKEGMKEGAENCVSVMLDCHFRCDPHKPHYWEVFPLDCEYYQENQCDINDVEKLLEMIERSLIEISA